MELVNFSCVPSFIVRYCLIILFHRSTSPTSDANTISTGLLKSIITPRGNILFCFADDIGISCIVSKTEGKIKCTFEDKKEPSSNEREDFINFLTGNTKEFQTLSGIFKREN